MANLTKIENLINPEVMADYIDSNLTGNIAFAQLAEIDSTLECTDGDTVILPKYSYIGDAVNVDENGEIPVAQLTASSVKITVSKAAKGVSITDEAALAGYGDPIGEINKQLALSLAQKMDSDCNAALDTIKPSMTSGDGSSPLSSEAIADALVLFGENADGAKALLINPAQLAQLRKDPNYMNASEISTDLLMSGSVGMVWGCNIILKNKIKSVSGKYTNYIVKPGALKIYMKRDTNIELDRIAKNKRTDIYADKIYAAYLYDESKAIKISVKE